MKHKITALSVQKRDRQRVSVYLDGEFAFGLQRIVAAWLQVGQEISDEKIAELVTHDSQERAYQRALNFLSYRPRSEAEIRKRLLEKDVSEENVDLVIERLRRNGMLNDLRFARAWIENRSENRPRSRRALNYELKRRGVDPETIEQALQSVDDEEMAYRAAVKRTSRLEGLDRNEFRSKLYRFLSQRGFNYDVISQVTSRVWEEHNEKENSPHEKEIL